MGDYDDLVARRKNCHRCGPGVINPSSTKYDSSQIGPWSRWLGARPAKIMIVGSIWGTETNFELQLGKDNTQSDTNRKLKTLLNLISIDVPNAGEKKYTGDEIFLTNAILCLKDETKNYKTLEKHCFENCSDFLRETIEAVAPKYIIPLGKRAFKAVIRAFPEYYPEGVKLPKWDNARTSGPIHMGTRKIFGVYRPSPWDWKYRSDQDQRDDWLEIGRYIEREDYETLSKAYLKLKQKQARGANLSPSQQSP